MTAEVWHAMLDRYERRGTVTERLMAITIQRLMELDGAERVLDRMSSDILEGQL